MSFAVAVKFSEFTVGNFGGNCPQHQSFQTNNLLCDDFVDLQLGEGLAVAVLAAVTHLRFVLDDGDFFAAPLFHNRRGNFGTVYIWRPDFHVRPFLVGNQHGAELNRSSFLKIELLDLEFLTLVDNILFSSSCNDGEHTFLVIRPSASSFEALACRRFGK